MLFRFQAIEHVVHVPGTFEPENATEHSYNLTMTAWFLAQHSPYLDRDTVIRYALAHDLVEVHAGDTYVFADPAALASKTDAYYQELYELFSRNAHYFTGQKPPEQPKRPKP